MDIKQISHALAVQLLGEIDAVCLESEPCKGMPSLTDVVVYLEVRGHRIELIRELKSGDGIISHAITRDGIRSLIAATP